MAASTQKKSKRKRSSPPRLAPAKITPPRLGECLNRERLFGLLDGFREKPAVWISGPAGSGKTMLAASYLEAAAVPYLWYQIDARDADIATLFYYLGLATKQKTPRRRKPLPLLTPEYLGGLETFTRNFFEALYERLKPPFVLVFDNCHELSDDGQFGQVIRDAVEVLPHGGRVLLISRGEPPKPLARLQVHQEMAMLGWEALQLTLDEVRSIARIFRKEKLTDGEVAAVHGKTLGWTAGVVLWLTQSRKDLLAADDDDLSAPESVFDYFAGEILAELDDGTRDFLTRSAFLPQITPATAGTLTGHKAASRILADLVSRNYFTYRCDHRKRSLYQYHPLFKAFLQEQARVLMSDREFFDLQLSAARILLENGQHGAGAALLKTTGEWEALSQLICDQAPSLVSQGRFGTVQKWLACLPEKTVMQSPWLLYWLAVCCMPFEPTESQKHFERAFALFKDQGDVHGVFLAWSGAVDATYFHMVKLWQLDYWIDELEDLRAKHHTFPSQEIETRVTISMLRALVWRQPQNPRIHYWEKRAVFLWGHVSDVDSRLQLGLILIKYYYFMGKHKESVGFLEPLNRLARSSNAHPLAKIVASAMNAYYYWPLGENALVMQWADKALKLSDQTGIHVWNCLILGINIFAALCSGKKEAADKLLDKMSKVIEQNVQNTDTAFYYFLLSWRTALDRETSLAVEYAVKALKTVMQHGAVIPGALCRHALSWGFFDQGKVRPAHANLQKVLNIALAVKSSLLKFSCLLAQAYFFLREGRKRSGLEVLSEAFSLGRERGFLQMFYWRPEIIAFLCTTALEHDIEVSYARRLIRNHGLLPDKSRVGAKRWPWTVKIVTLGRFEVVIDDRPIVSEGNAQGKPLMLLKALIAFGGHEVKEEQLSEALWPDAEGDAAHVAFNTTLHRLRKRIGHEDAIILKGRRLSFDFGHCWVDLQVVNHLLGEAENFDIRQSEDTLALQRLAEEILKIYQGPFLAADDTPWAIGPRDRLQAKTLRVLKMIGAHLEAQNLWEGAVELYERGTEIDPVAEILYQGIMRCHANLGRSAEALATYQKCRETISRLLGVNLSPQTESLRKKLQK